MDTITLTGDRLSGERVRARVLAALEMWENERGQVRRALILPPDFTRLHSGAGAIVRAAWDALSARAAVDVMPALGTHAPMTASECARMYPGVPLSAFIAHDWRRDVACIGCVPGDFLAEISGGFWRADIPVEVNRRLLDDRYDLILSVGQVVPHEVAGMANHAKNLFVGCGGSGMINASHLLGALCGMESAMGRDHAPVRRVLDYAFEHFMAARPVLFALTVTDGAGDMRGLFIGNRRDGFEAAAALSGQVNVTRVEKPLQTCVCYLDPAEFKSTWLGNKAIYRARMAMADGGRLIVLAPGVNKFGEDAQNNALIRKYGYRGREKILALLRDNADLRENAAAAAHLIHGSSEGRFNIIYAVSSDMRGAVEAVGYGSADYAAMAARYLPNAPRGGWNRLADGEEFYFIPNPALGLWQM